jgi:hypothetical protein
MSKFNSKFGAAFLLIVIVLLCALIILPAYSNSQAVDTNNLSNYVNNVMAGSDNSYKIVYKDMKGLSSEGGKGELWYFNNSLIKMEIHLYASMGQSSITYDFSDSHIAININQMYYEEEFNVEKIDYFENKKYIIVSQNLYLLDDGTEQMVLCSNEEKDKIVKELLDYGKALEVEMKLDALDN